MLVASPFDLLSELAPGALELVLGDYAADNDHPWHRLERGELAFSDYWADLLVRAKAASVTIDTSKLSGGVDRFLVVHEPMVERIRALRAAGYATAVVTNNIREFSGTWRSTLPLDELFDAVVDSCEVGIRKPNPRIYLHALSLLGGVAPERAVFLDDAPGNVAGARAAGLAAIHVADPDVALAELDALLAG